MITPPERHDSTQSTFAGLQRLCADAEDRGALSAALLCTQPWLDVPELGWSVVVTWDGDPDAALSVAQEMAGRAWVARQDFMETSERDLTEAIDIAFEIASEERGPVVIADMGDATNGGALGDSTELLRGLLARRARGQAAGPSALTVVAPDAVESAWRAGEGVEVDLQIGRGPAGAFNEATSLTGVVERMWDATVTYSHAAAEGVVDYPGRAALVASEDILVIVHSRPVRVIDPSLYIAAGIDIEGLRVVQAKSHVSFRAGFDKHVKGSVLADTKGPTAANLTFLPFSRRPYPLFPFEDCEWTAESESSPCHG